MANERTDVTPFLTRLILVTVLAVTAIIVGLLYLGLIDPDNTESIARILWAFTGLFVFRVVGQMLVALRPQRWLPPMAQWNFIPYTILLPVQFIFIGVMAWVNLSFTSNSGISIEKNTDVGNFLLAGSAVYVLVMLIRYIRKMITRPDQRWFGGTIPIVFHIVLASYLYTLGCFYVGG